MSENLLQFIWQHRLYNTSQPLISTEGDVLIVLHPGTLNTNAGPDFLEAKIKTGNTIWAGNIELHVLSSDWKKHHHDRDKNYNKLILHVVYENDVEIHRDETANFMTLELAPYINTSLLSKYEHLMANKGFIPCEKNIHLVKPIVIQQQLQRMLAERLEEKTAHIKQLLLSTNNNWQEVFYIQMARGFGMHINQDAFEKLALNTSLSLFAKHKNNPLQIEALLFGQAGFLADYFDEPYPLLLQQEYVYLKKLHSLTPVDKSLWKFLRLRPANFPTIRIAQFAQLIQQSTHLFSKITNSESLKELEEIFEVKVNEYWNTHYTFNEASAAKSKKPGKGFIHSIVINVIVPALFVYGKLQGKSEYCDKAMNLLTQLLPEKNKLTAEWQQLTEVIETAADTQGALQLYNKYCLTKKCLECSIGYSILNK